MELILSVAIGVFAGSGVWLLLLSRTFQVIMGLSLLYVCRTFIYFRHGAFNGRAASCH